ncbi:MAG TPA: glycosyltransferase family 9 protein [Candidatus Methylomirabilis sp.]|nr:glycosyltransferase family 9 protein [Candidatus Methylomirabilis sp.]
MWPEAGRALERTWKRLVLEGLRAGCRAAVAVRPLPAIDGKPPAPGSIVVFSTAGIGDTLSDTPAIRALRESFPSCRITAVVHQRRLAVLEGNPNIDRLIPHAKGPVRFLRTLRAIRRERPDMAVTLRANDPDVWPLAYLSGARVIASRPQMTHFPFLVNVPVHVPDWMDRPGVEQTLEIVRAVGADTADPRMDFVVPEGASRRVEALLVEQACAEDPLVAMQVHVSPRLAFRDWPVEHFVTLGRMILAKQPIRLVITGGREDVPAARAVGGALGRGATVVAGNLALPETAGLLSRCRMLVTTDTGIMHLGFAVGVPTLALLHPYNAHRVGPHGYAGLHRVVLLNPALWQGEDPPRVGLDRLSPEEVFLAFREFWRASG